MLLKEMEDVELANRLNVLVYEIYLDAQYRERTCLRMHDLVIDLETRLEKKGVGVGIEKGLVEEEQLGWAI